MEQHFIKNSTDKENALAGIKRDFPNYVPDWPNDYPYLVLAARFGSNIVVDYWEDSKLRHMLKLLESGGDS